MINRYRLDDAALDSVSPEEHFVSSRYCFQHLPVRASIRVQYPHLVSEVRRSERLLSTRRCSKHLVYRDCSSLAWHYLILASNKDLTHPCVPSVEIREGNQKGWVRKW